MSDATPLTGMTVEQRRVAFGQNASAYDASRPRWPAELVTWLIGGPHAQTQTVLDVGCGTGLGSRALAELGHHVIGVEPDPRMARCAADSGISTTRGQAERLPLGAASVDAVVALQSWHWFAAHLASEECRRVTRPGGWLGIGWHIPGRDEQWQRDLAQMLGGRLNPPQLQDQRPHLGAGWGHVEARDEPVIEWLTPQHLAQRARTWSAVAANGSSDEVAQKVLYLTQSHAGTDGLVRVPGRWWFFRAQAAA